MLTLIQILEVTTLSKPTWYRMIKIGLAPRPIKIGMRRVAWKKDDIDAFLASREYI